MPLGKFGKNIIIEYLMYYEGMNQAQATKAVTAVINIIKEELRKGNNVELEGIGVLRLVDLNTRRQIKKNLLKSRGVQSPEPSIVPTNKYKKTVRLKSKLKLEVLDAEGRDGEVPVREEPETRREP